ncbi:hypothetical protein G8E10_06025 [Rhizobiaceae bacterium CRRU44]|uniref:Uracil-DNA glycosylase-like domain-containing protein n=1 Tax=Ferranicluibacter rubi TaxID=2715133 RepID=A0AA43ZE50_9HYPH|nr:hypothetical protein [Ferranicluibacter rubi]NHT75308.1 hypothetical protein [Ferranicluibacter rubi]
MSTSSLKQFEQDLRNVIGGATKVRPFVCSGSPFEASIFLVGYNPATEMGKDFWSFWSETRGFDKEAWIEEYIRERQTKPLKPGKSFRPTISPTRRNIEGFIKAAFPAAVLETNIFAVASETKPELALTNRDTTPFRYLVRTIRPKVIVAHGKDACEVVSQLETGAHVIAVKHLSRGWSKEAIARLGVEASAAWMA